MRRALVVVALSLLVTGSAAAESKSWTAVKKTVDPKAAIIVGVNLAPIRTTTTYTMGVQLLMQQAGDAKRAFDAVKTTCSIDLLASFSDATFIFKDVGAEPLVVLGLDGLDEAKMLSCMKKVIAGMAGGNGDIEISAKKKGKIVEYTITGAPKKIYAAWLAPDVVAFTDDTSDRTKLTKMLAGKAPKGIMASGLAKISTSAPIWGVVAKKDKESYGTLLGGYGQVDIARGAITGSAHVIWSKPAEAQAALAEAQKGLDEAKAEAAKYPKVQKALGSVTLGVTGKELDLTGSVDDKDIIQLFTDFDHVF